MVLVVFQVAYALSNVTTVVANWYARPRARRTRTQFVVRVLPMVRRVLLVVIYGVAGLVALDSVGVSISPFLGGLGITGLAVALALQPTLSNFFAGTYVLSDGAIVVGDYIELQGGPAGYIIEIGWRSTKMRTWLNNLVIVPNSVMADTIVTNYQAPDPAINIMVTCGVSYSSDLGQVERVSLEVAQQVLDEVPGAVKEMEAWFGYDSFGDSNIGFWLFLQAQDRGASFVVTNELIKRLHARFAQEGIEINYPVRKLVYGDGVAKGPVP
jgi:small-conductance mechanosensitive channel